MKRVALLAMLAVGCGGVSVQSFQEAAREAKRCDPLRDVCVNAGGAQCLCATPVIASKKAEIDNLAKQVGCGGAQVECAQSLNPRCVDGFCVSDIQ